jgi:hypothetical protein
MPSHCQSLHIAQDGAEQNHYQVRLRLQVLQAGDRNAVLVDLSGLAHRLFITTLRAKRCQFTPASLLNMLDANVMLAGIVTGITDNTFHSYSVGALGLHTLSVGQPGRPSTAAAGAYSARSWPARQANVHSLSGCCPPLHTMAANVALTHTKSALWC